jgi:hypothetical protein
MADKPTKRFNTAGVCVPDEHYMLPALPRLPDVSDMVEGKFYFVLHAPRQSGKTTCLNALTEKINAEGRYYALQCSLASLMNTEEERLATEKVVSQINTGLNASEVPELNELAYSFDDRPYMPDPYGRVRNMLNDLCRNLDRDLVVFFDEADCLHADPLVLFLSQIRDGYLARTNSPRTRFPRSLALVGMRDVRDYLYRVRPDGESTGEGSPFNITADPMTLANFTLEEINALYGQHTAETGQPFEPEAVSRAWYWTEGQPWLVNALADHVVVNLFGNDCSKTVTGMDIDAAARDLILRRKAHFVSLAKRLEEPRVKKVIEPVIVGSKLPKYVSNDDKDYVVDLGLLKKDPDAGGLLRPSNPIYGELIVRALTDRLEDDVPHDLQNKWMDGTRLDMDSLLKAFQAYWRENSEIAFGDKDEENASLSNEATAHLVLFAFLQRVINGGADIKREYAAGKTRVDICVTYKGIRYPLELKLKGALSRKKSLEQLSGYMDRCGTSAGWLIVFDRDFKKDWKKRLFWKKVNSGGMAMRVVGC